MIFSLTNDYYLQVASYILIIRYKANIVKLDQVCQTFFKNFMKSRKFLFHLFLTPFKVTLAAFPLWQYSYKTQLMT